MVPFGKNLIGNIFNDKHLVFSFVFIFLVMSGCSNLPIRINHFSTNDEGLFFFNSIGGEISAARIKVGEAPYEVSLILSSDITVNARSAGSGWSFSLDYVQSIEILNEIHSGNRSLVYGLAQDYWGNRGVFLYDPIADSLMNFIGEIGAGAGGPSVSVCYCDGVSLIIYGHTGFKNDNEFLQFQQEVDWLSLTLR